MVKREERPYRAKRSHRSWHWIPSLFAAEEIPSAVVIYVALIMFLQFGASEVLASVYSALLFLPWVLKSYLYTKVLQAGAFKRYIHIAEGLMFICLMGIAVYLSEGTLKVWVLFLFLLALSFLCAWHEILSRIYYDRMLSIREQHIYGNVKMVSSQVSLVVTYGVLIIAAGFFEVFFRSYQKAWAMESSLVAGAFLVFFALNVAVVPSLRKHGIFRDESLAVIAKREQKVVERMKQKPQIFRVLLCLVLLLLPQALLFNTRVFFLMASRDEGGLGCSVQEVGFAQGTIGVIAFSVGIGLGRLLMKRIGQKRMFWLLSVLLTLSPLSYWLMAHSPQHGNLFALCCVTFFAQVCLGLGLNVCGGFVRYISEQRYRNTMNYLYVPLIAGAMLVPMMLSGWLCTMWGYALFFAVCVAIAPVAWLITGFCNVKSLLTEERIVSEESTNDHEEHQ